MNYELQKNSPRSDQTDMKYKALDRGPYLKIMAAWHTNIQAHTAVADVSIIGKNGNIVRCTRCKMDNSQEVQDLEATGLDKLHNPIQ